MGQSETPLFTWQTIETGDEGPGVRSRHGLVYDAGAGATVLFGGIVWSGSGRVQSDTWELKDGRWSKVWAFPFPGGRHRGAMVFDRARGFSIVFGGQAATGAMFGDTWIYASRRWRKRWNWPGRRPTARCGHAMAFDEEARVTVLFGGIVSGDRTLGDTWVFDGSSWQKVDGPSPPARRYAALAFDPGLNGCLLHGGSVDDAGRQQFGDAWLFHDRTWTRLPAGFETDARDDHGLAYHRAAETMVMLDGLSASRGVLARGRDGWQEADCEPLHPRHQCAPLAWDENLGGLVLHGGETGHGRPQFSATRVLRLAGNGNTSG